MKQFVRNILSVCLVAMMVLSACTQKEQVNYTIISGTLSNAEGKEIILNSGDFLLSLDTLEKTSKVIEPDDNGVFSDTLQINRESNFVIAADRSYLRIRLNPGDHLHLTADCNDLQNSTTYTGTGSATNTYLLAKQKIFDRSQKEYRERGFLDEEAFIKNEEDYQTEYHQLISSSSGLSDEFIANEKKDLKYGMVKSYIYYAMYYKMRAGDEAPDLSPDFLDIVSAVDMEDIHEYRRTTDYAFLLRGYYNYEFSKSTDPASSDPFGKLEFLSEIISDQEILDEMFMMYGKYDITNTGELQAYYDLFMERVSNQTYKDAITLQYNDLLSTQPGQPSPSFTDYRNYDGSVNSLSDFSGKYVYIDVWATWCGPCKAEIPFLKKVEKRYHNKNIEFISISVDAEKDFEKWKKFVQDEELGGVQLFADNAWESEFVTKYQIKGIPQFILIDPEGKIVRPSAPRPSDDKLTALFDELGI